MSSLDLDWSFSSEERTWFKVILDSSPRQLSCLGSEISDNLLFDCCKFISCPDEMDWFVSHGCKFAFHCIGHCSLCTAHFLLNPKVYRYTTIGDIDDPYLEIEKEVTI